jgi:hypothetical protein
MTVFFLCLLLIQYIFSLLINILLNTEMASIFSPVPKEIIKKGGPTIVFPVVIHKEYRIANDVAKKRQEDFNKVMRTHIDVGTVSPCPQLGEIHFMPLTMPESLPERLGLVAEAMDLTALNDGNDRDKI